MPLLISSPVMAENFTVKGDMTSTVRYELQQQVTAGDGMKQMSLSFVVPQTFQSPTYVQEIKDFNLLLKPEPQEKKPALTPAATVLFLPPGQKFHLS